MHKARCAYHTDVIDKLNEPKITSVWQRTRILITPGEGRCYILMCGAGINIRFEILFARRAFRLMNSHY